MRLAYVKIILQRRVSDADPEMAAISDVASATGPRGTESPMSSDADKVICIAEENSIPS
jgi:hypothetical protein